MLRSTFWHFLISALTKRRYSLSCCEKAKVSIQLNTSVTQVKREDTGFELTLHTGERISCQSLVVATGGLSIPSLGASPYGYQLAAQFGLPIIPTRPGLVPLTLQPDDKIRFSNLSGVSLPCEVSCNQQTFALDLLFTHRGLSGPAILQISSYWTPGAVLTINLDPNTSSEHDIPALKREKTRISHCFSSTLPKRVIQTMLTENMLDAELQNLSTKTIQDLIQNIQQWQIKPNATEGYRTAEVTLGGVDTTSLSSKTMEVNSVPGLYFIGEVQDVTGWLGGYNFQWAWSSGWAAGQVA
ncbi:MAG: aminoacetone oxidase family FAD-binding enzyme [Legionellales bacterium]|nr:aminoacetone oxidase family FAD-binding enzyme [Legionellales bacterium]